MPDLHILSHHVLSVTSAIPPRFKKMSKSAKSHFFCLCSSTAQSIHYDEFLLVACKLCREYVISNRHIKLKAVASPNH
jgi:hypothetical protein